MTLGSAGALVVAAGLAGTLCSRGEPRPPAADSVAVDSQALADTGARGDSAVPLDSAARGDSAARPDVADSSPLPRIPAESGVRRPPIMDPAPRQRPPRLPRPDSSGSGS